MRAKYINEKFSDINDPIKDMGIGMYKDFDSKIDLMNWIIEHIPAVLNTPSIPNDILDGKDGNLFKEKYYRKLNAFMNKHVSFKGVPIKSSRCEAFLWPSDLYKLIHKHGIAESFTDSSDPIKDMGIGINADRLYQQMTDIIDRNPDDYDCGYILSLTYDTDTDTDRIYVTVPYRTFSVGKELKNLLKQCGVTVKSTIKYTQGDTNTYEFVIQIKRKVNEKFEEDSDPIHDMGIGIRSKLEGYKFEKALKYLDSYYTVSKIFKTIGLTAKDLYFLGDNEMSEPYDEEDTYFEDLLNICKGKNIKKIGSIKLESDPNIPILFLAYETPIGRIGFIDGLSRCYIGDVNAAINLKVYDHIRLS